jgi:hypothetical protein
LRVTVYSHGSRTEVWLLSYFHCRRHPRLPLPGGSVGKTLLQKNMFIFYYSASPHQTEKMPSTIKCGVRLTDVLWTGLSGDFTRHFFPYTLLPFGEGQAGESRARTSFTPVRLIRGSSVAGRSRPLCLVSSLRSNEIKCGVKMFVP